MSTTTLHISLPESLKKYVQERIAEKHYSNPSDYVRALIREDQKRRDKERLEQMLLEGIHSRPDKVITPEEWRTLRKEVYARIKKQEWA